MKILSYQHKRNSVTNYLFQKDDLSAGNGIVNIKIDPHYTRQCVGADIMNIITMAHGFVSSTQLEINIRKNLFVSGIHRRKCKQRN